MRAPQLGKNNGFTLVEVIVVIMFIAIFATLAVSRQPYTDVTLKARVEVLKSHLRYTQMRAMSSDRGWGLEYDGDPPGYWLFRQGDTNRITLPGETQNSVDLLSSGVTITQGDFRLIFDRWGRPDTAASTLTFNAGTRSAVLTLSKAGDSETITISQNTGFIQ